MHQNPLTYVGSTLDRLKDFPDAARQDAGHQLHRAQLGLEPSEWRSMATGGSGVVEIHLEGQGEPCVMYIAKLPRGVYVLHAFEMKSRQIPEREIEMARRNLAEVLRPRDAT